MLLKTKCDTVVGGASAAVHYLQNVAFQIYRYMGIIIRMLCKNFIGLQVHYKDKLCISYSFKVL